MPKPTICPNPGCQSHEFEAVHMFGGTDHDAYIIQCRKCGTAIGAVNKFYPLTAAIGNIEEKITGSRSI
jgi:hypothetical protein